MQLLRDNALNVEDAVRAVSARAKDVSAVVMVATYKAAARFIERLHDAGLGKLVYTNVSDVDSNALADELAQLGPGYAEGVVVTQVVPPPTGKATTLLRYQEQLRKYAAGEKPSYLSLEGWISARLLIEGLQRTGRNLTTDGLIDALEGIRGLAIGTLDLATAAITEEGARRRVGLVRRLGGPPGAPPRDLARAGMLWSEVLGPPRSLRGPHRGPVTPRTT